MSRNSSPPKVDNDAFRPVSVVSQPPEEQLNRIFNPGCPQAQALLPVDNTLFGLLDDIADATSVILSKITQLSRCNSSNLGLRSDPSGVKVQRLRDLNSKLISEVSKLCSDEIKAQLPRPPPRRNSDSRVNGGGNYQQHFQHDYDQQRRF